MNKDGHEIVRIEMLGFPCTGKSYYINKVYNDLSYLPLKANVAPSIKNIFSFLLFVVRNPKYLKLFTLLKYVPLHSIRLQLSSTIRFILRAQRLEIDTKNKTKRIVDEGIIQATWAILLLPAINLESKEVVKNLKKIKLEFWPKCEMQINYIKIDDREYKRRIRNRFRKHHFTEAVINDNKIIYEIGIEVMKLIKDQCVDRYEFKEVG